MARRSHFFTILALIALVVVAKLGQQAYRWYAHAEEREQIRTLQDEVEDAGLTVVRGQAEIDSLRTEIDRIDDELDAKLIAVRSYEEQSSGGTIDAALYPAYATAVDEYNEMVARRNEVADGWEVAVEQHRENIENYNAIANRIREVAQEMGLRYFDVPSPVEIGIRHGLLDPDSLTRDPAVEG